MAGRVSTSLSTLLNPFGPTWKGKTEKSGEAKPVGEQVQNALFGKRKPRELPEDDFPQVQALLKKLDGYRRKLAKLASDPESDYRLKLSEGMGVMIDAQGTIYFGLNFLLRFRENWDVLVGALAHEIGHRPKRWREYKTKESLTKTQVESLCRYEETRADLFAGKGLAALSLDPGPMIQFLEEFQEGSHPEYFPVKMRAEVIWEGFREQQNMAIARENFASIWPELLQEYDIKRHIGDL